MEHFWNGFEKRAVSLAWINRMRDRGVLSRSGLGTDKVRRLLDERYLSDMSSKNNPISQSWRGPKSPSAEIKKTVSEVGKTTKGDKKEAIKKLKEIREDLGAGGNWDFRNGDLFVGTSKGHVVRKFLKSAANIGKFSRGGKTTPIPGMRTHPSSPSVIPGHGAVSVSKNLNIKSITQHSKGMPEAGP